MKLHDLNKDADTPNEENAAPAELAHHADHPENQETEPLVSLRDDIRQIRDELEGLRQGLEQIAERPPQAEGPIPLLSVKDVAAWLNVSKRTVETLIASGDLNPMRIRSKRMFAPKNVEAYLRTCARGTQAQRRAA